MHITCMGFTAYLGCAGKESVYDKSVDNLQGIPCQSVPFLERHSMKLDAIRPDLARC